MEKSWTKVDKSAGGDFESTKWVCEDMPELEGTLTSKKEDIGVHQQSVFNIETEDGTDYTVWGTTVLTKLLEPLAIGTYLKIVYLGKQKTKNNSGSYKDFDLFIAEGEPEFDQAETTVATSPDNVEFKDLDETPKVDKELEAIAEEVTEKTLKEEEVPF